MNSQNLKFSREEVYTAVDSERSYQETLTRNDVTDQRPLEQLALIETIIQRAKAEWYDNPGAFNMNYMRKIAGVAVRSMEQWGAPKR